MKISTLVVIMVTLTNYANSQLYLTENLNNNVRLGASPQFIVEGLTSNVDIECTFNRASVPSMASVMSMLIAYSNETDQPVFNYLASVNGIEGHAHNVSHDVDVISGSIDNNGESKLHMRFMYPKTYLIGLYMCEVTGFDEIGRPVTILSKINVVTSKINDLFDLIHNLTLVQNSVLVMQSCIASQAEYLSTLNRKLYPTLDTDYFRSIFYKGHDYYLSQYLKYNFNRNQTQTTCESFGGYLVELDTQDEFLFIRDFLVKLNMTSYVYTGAIRKEQDGVWINEHSSTSRQSFAWAPGEPDSGKDGSCQCFYPVKNLFLGDCTCFYQSTAIVDARYICEIPRNIC